MSGSVHDYFLKCDEGYKKPVEEYKVLASNLNFTIPTN